jgi:hypothetical protein
VLTLSALAALASLLLPAGGSAVPIAKPFRTPSGHIGCYYTTEPTFLRCDVTFRTRFGGKRCAEGDIGHAFGMTANGRARALCVSDTAIEPRAPVLAYGATRRDGPYACTSRPSGLTCKNRKGHGWMLSRRRQKLF